LVPGNSLLYTGRAPGFSGLDRFVFAVPANAPTGCFVPVYVIVNGAVSNPTTMAIMPQGGTCSDTQNPISAALLQGGKIVDSLFFEATTSVGQFAGIPVAIAVDKTTVRAMQEPGGQFAFDPFLATPPPGACTGYTMAGNILATGFLMASSGRALGLGTLSAVSGSTSVTLKPVEAGLYDTTLGGGYPSTTPLFFQPSITPSLQAGGGADGAAFSVPVPHGLILAGANLQALTNISRSQSSTVTWTPQDAVSAYISGGVYNLPTNSSAMFLCVSPPGASSFTVPSYVLANLPPGAGAHGPGDARLFFGALPALTETTTPDQIRIFSTRQDFSVLAINSIQ
jgi:hypothetical protein